MAERSGVLVVGADEETAHAVREAARQVGLAVHVAGGLGEGLRALQDGRWTVTVLSLDLEGADLDLVERISQEVRAGAVVLVAARPGPDLAMRAMQSGAFDLLAVPAGPEAFARALSHAASERGRIALPDPAEEAGRELVGGSPELLEVFKAVGQVAPSLATVLILGESGTGKELVAQAIHRMSRRASRPFVAVNCAAIPEDLLESELFGHERGAFTGAVARKVGRFERAHGGTLFLDEIGDMSLVLQAKILRALQEREIERVGGEESIPVDVRVVAATHRDLALLIAEGDFREDLYYRLAVVRLHLAPLRERVGDVRDLALHFAARFAAEHARPLRYMSAAALGHLEEHRWPGNVRELRNVIERAVLTAPGDTLRLEHLHIDPPRVAAAGEVLPGYSTSLSMAEIEALHISRVLEDVDGHLSRAAEILGMHRNTVSRKAQEYGLRAG